MRIQSENLCIILAVGVVTAACNSRSVAINYYVSPSGDDANSGLDPALPWRTVAKVNSTTFAPNSQILFQRGGEWRETLIASSSGAPGQPITYDAYGAGPKPRFWGSEILDHAAFQPLSDAPSTYSMITTPVYSVLLDHQFMHSAELLTSSGDSQINIDYVKAHSNSWYYNGDRLYLNAGGINPANDPRLYTAVVHDDVVFTNGKDHMVFRNLIADESARRDAGYAFRVQNSNDVVIEDSEAYRAGKHHFGVIESTNFVGKNLYTSTAMPDQGYGGASAYVSFSDSRRSGDTSTWIDVVADSPNGPYPGFVSHGGGLGRLSIQNMVIHGGAGMTVGIEDPNGSATVKGGRVENGPLEVWGNVTVHGISVTGLNGAIGLNGSNNVIENSVLIGRVTNWWAGQKGAIVDNGTNNIIRFNTIIPGPNEGGGGVAVAITNPVGNSEIYGNAFADSRAIGLFDSTSPIQSHDNLFAPNSQFWVVQNNFIYTKTLQEWQALGYDLNSDNVLLADANFDGKIDAADYALIDNGYLSQNVNAGYHNGDFNFSGGPPNADDYFMIDQALARFWMAQTNLTEIGVPEPGAMALVVAASILFACLRPRSILAPDR